MKKLLAFIFIAACLALCLIPSAGMLIAPTTETTENRAMAAPPEVMKDGEINRQFFGDFESWFDEHIALRNHLVYADAMIQTNIFQESNVSGVIKGTDGWLYYSSTLDDYLGRSVMSEAELSNLAQNFAIVQEYLEKRGIDFVMTIPPNKNTLYGEHMPYYDSVIVNPDHSAKLLGPYLSELGVSYLDLFKLFESEDEVLYLRQDSHWNNKGALMAYNAIMDSLVIDHEDYSAAAPSVTSDPDGDLNRMLYSFYGQPEDNFDYNLPAVSYTTGDDVEDGWIVTENDSGEGTLLMFRDSFANTLIPFMSNHFRTAAYSKGIPNAMERYVEEYSPDCVVIEKVERNIDDFLTNPPIITPPTADLPDSLTISDKGSTARIEECMYDINYWKLSGELDENRAQRGTEVLVSVNGTVYKAYRTGETGWLMYLKKDALDGDNAELRVYAVNDGQCVQLIKNTIESPNN